MADTSAQTLPFSQNWTNTGLITADDNWAGVPGIIGYRGDALTGATGVDPQTVVADGSGTPVDVNANHSDPNTFTTGGVTEFDGIANPVVALQGSGTARAPHIVIALNTTGQTNINVSYNLRDIDGSADNSVQPVALQYRVGGVGNYTNIPAGFVADASSGPSLATLVTPVSVTLPAACENQSLVQLRVITTDAIGSDEWIGIDDISVTTGGGGPTNPSGVGAANPNTVAAGNTTLLTVTVTPGTNPASTGITVTGDLTSIGGSATQTFFDNGTNGDVTAGDNIFSFLATVAGATTGGAKSLPISIADAQARAGSTTISLTVQAPPVAIHDIQGSGTTSPLANSIATTSGIVTGLRSNGFFLQTPDANADADPNTSEGIFVFTSSAPTVSVGNAVTVSGTVQEFIPATDPGSPSQTEIANSPSVSVNSTGNPLPAAITLTAADTLVNDVNNLEKYEGMRVHVNSLTVVGPTGGNIDEANATSSSFGDFYGVITGVARPFREPGIESPYPIPTPYPSGAAPASVPIFDANPERLRINSLGLVGSTDLQVATNAVVTNITGPLDYGFRTYTIDTDPSPTPTVTGGMTAVPAPVPNSRELTIASFNMQRFFDTTDDPSVSDVVLTTTAFNNRLNKASLAIRNMLNLPDVIGVEEMENLTTLQAVATKINNDEVAASRPNPGYTAYLSEGNDVGGIDVGFLVKSTVTVFSVTQYNKSETFNNPTGGPADLLNDRP
ncbi:MAG TPA: hypothetical protein VK619_18650, partial [Pyrinomonadaceae bacterium]|nr:hypothetical protein [Pyrinomonadaceae bacterium]